MKATLLWISLVCLFCTVEKVLGEDGGVCRRKSKHIWICFHTSIALADVCGLSCYSFPSLLCFSCLPSSGPSSICCTRAKPQVLKKSKWTYEAILRLLYDSRVCGVSIPLTTYFLFENRRKRLPHPAARLAAGLAAGPAPGLLTPHPRNRRRAGWAKAVDCKFTRQALCVSASRQIESNMWIHLRQLSMRSLVYVYSASLIFRCLQ
jgi:hypothetical protein